MEFIMLKIIVIKFGISIFIYGGKSFSCFYMLEFVK